MKMKAAFFTMFFVTAALTLALVTVLLLSPQEVVEKPLSIQEQNDSNMTVIFTLTGESSVEVALFVGQQTKAATLTLDKPCALVLTGNERQSISLRIKSGQDWETVHTFGMLDYGATIRIVATGESMTIWTGSRF